MSNPEEQNSIETGNVDQIRDIIFGSQMRDYEKRFSRLEERVLSETNALRSETENRLDALESYIKQQANDLLDQLTTERGEREDDTQHLSNEIDKLGTNTEKKRSQMNEKFSKNQSELRDSLLDQSKKLRTEIQDTRNVLNTSMDHAIEELRSDKTDRKALASMFTEIAMRLNDEFEIPGQHE